MATIPNLVDSARKGNLSRRGFLSAALALGLGPTEAEKELVPKLYSFGSQNAAIYAFYERELGKMSLADSFTQVQRVLSYTWRGYD